MAYGNVDRAKRINTRDSMRTIRNVGMVCLLGKLETYTKATTLTM